MEQNEVSSSGLIFDPSYNTAELHTSAAERQTGATTPDAATATPRVSFKRVLTRETVKPPFAGQRLGRAEVEQLLAIAADTGRPGAIDLRGVDLRGAELMHLNLSGAKFGDDDPLATEEERHDMAARLDRAVLVGANLERVIAPGVIFDGANLQNVRLAGANLGGCSLSGAHLANADLHEARLTEANLRDAQLKDADLRAAQLVGAHLDDARLVGAHLEGTDLGLANLARADLRFGYCDEQTYFGGAILQGALLDGLRLRDTDLTATDWHVVTTLGEEHEAAHAQPRLRATAFRVAARTYRRLGTALRAQGIADDGVRFLARARTMEERAQRATIVDRWSARAYLGAMVAATGWLGTVLQGLVTAHGYHPARAFSWAAFVVILFAPIYMLVIPQQPTIYSALLLSVAALLGHGYILLAAAAIVPSLATLIALLESFCGTVLIVLFAVAFARKISSF